MTENSFKRELTYFLLLISILLIAIPSIVVGRGESPNLSMSLTPEVSDPSSLDGEVVSGDIYVFVSSKSAIEMVRFYLDGTFVRTEKSAPYAFSGDSKGLLNPFDTTQLTAGSHTISAEIVLNNGATEFLTSNFTVDGATTVDVPTTSTLSMSLTPEGSDPSSLEGQAVSGDIYVFVDSENYLEQVQFYLDGTFVRTEKNAPYAFSGDSKGLLNPFDTAQLAAGSHTISAEIVLNNGAKEVLTANFIVETHNAQPFDPMLTLTWYPNPKQEEIIGYEVHYSLTPNATENDLDFLDDLSGGRAEFKLSSPKVTYSVLKDIGVQNGSVCFAVKAYSKRGKSRFSKIECAVI